MINCKPAECRGGGECCREGMSGTKSGIWKIFLNSFIISASDYINHQARCVTQLWEGSPGQGPGPGGWSAGVRPGSGTSVSSSEVKNATRIRQCIVLSLKFIDE